MLGVLLSSRWIAAATASSAALFFLGCTPAVSSTNGAGGHPTGATSTGTGATTGTASTSSTGGGGPALGAPFFGEGTRLKAHYVDYGGGVTSLIDWHDTMLDIECSFQLLDDGTVRCLPTPIASITTFATGLCGQPLLSVSGQGPCYTPPTYAFVMGQSQLCETVNGGGVPSSHHPASIYPIGSTVTPTTVYTQSGGQCNSGAPVAGTTYYQTGNAVPLSTFAGAKFTTSARGPRLSQRIITSDDGAWQTEFPFDGTSMCGSQVENGATICLPFARGNFDQGLFTDSGCTMDFAPQSVGFARTDICTPPTFAFNRTSSGPNGCTITDTFHSLGAKTTKPTIYDGTPGNCAALDLSVFDAYSVGGTIDPVATFGAMPSQTIGTAIQATFLGTSPTEPLGTPTVYTDVARNQPCYAVEFADGTVRCVDSDVPIAGFYSDAACSSEVVVQSLPGATGCGPTPAPYTIALESPPPAMCGLDPAVPHAVSVRSLSPYSGQLYAYFAGMCSKTTYGGTVAFYSLGPVMTGAEMNYPAIQLVKH